MHTDVTDERQVRQLVEQTVTRYGRLDVLVNNAGMGRGPLATTTTETFDDVMNVNLRGTFFCCRAGFTQMKQQGGGIIINMSSVAGVQAWAGDRDLQRLQAWHHGADQGVADEGRPFHIKVSAICPARSRTNWWMRRRLTSRAARRSIHSTWLTAALYLATLGKLFGGASDRHRPARSRLVIEDRLEGNWLHDNRCR